MNNQGNRTVIRGPISRFDADDSRLLKKEFLRLVRLRASIVRTMCDTDEEAIALANAASNRSNGEFLSEIESFIWQGVAMRIKSEMEQAKQTEEDPRPRRKKARTP